MKTKIIILAVALLLSGAIIFVAVMSYYGWDFTRLGSESYETTTYEITEDFSDISIESDTASIVFAPSEDGTRRVVCREPKKAKHSVSADMGKLNIKISDTRQWYDRIGFNFSTPKITVYLPEAEYGKLEIKESTGDIYLPLGYTFQSISLSLSTGDVSCYSTVKELLKINTKTGDITLGDLAAGSIDLSASTGDLTLSNVTASGSIRASLSTGDIKFNTVKCASFTSDGTTGDVTLKNTVVEGHISVERSTGDIILDMSDAKELTIKTSTGDIRGTLLTEKQFIHSTGTGTVKLPGTSSGGICRLTTSTGDIKIQLAN